jgi:hypothetical protein
MKITMIVSVLAKEQTKAQAKSTLSGVELWYFD